jgi:hypothetical protein
MLRFGIALLVVSACSAGRVEGVPAASTSTSTRSTEAPASIAAVTAGEASSEPVAIGTITNPALVEISGIVVGSDGVIWAHNDSGSSPRLWALDPSGSVVGSLEVEAPNIDWEDISIGSRSDGRVLVYLADIGDNLTARPVVAIHRFEEPTTLEGNVAEIESLLVRYPGGPADAEAFFVDPGSGDSFIVTKTPTGRSSLLRIPEGAWSNRSVEAGHVATLDLGGLSFVTAGAISADGSIIALRTYRSIWLWERHGDETIADAMRGTPCEVPSPNEPQGEALAFDGDDLLTVSEGADAVIYRIER